MRSPMLAAIAAVSLITASSAAVAQTAAPAAPVERAGASADSGSELRGLPPTIWVLGVVALGLLIWGLIEILDDNEGAPVSP